MASKKPSTEAHSPFTLAVVSSVFTVFLLTSIDVMHGFFSLSPVVKETMTVKYLIWGVFAVFTFVLAIKYLIEKKREVK